MPAHLSPAAAAQLATRARRLVQGGELTPYDYAIFDALLWRCRRQGESRCTASYDALQRLAHVARATVAQALRRLESAGLLSRCRRVILVPWAAAVHGGQRIRQLASAYVFHAVTASSSDGLTPGRTRKSLSAATVRLIPAPPEVVQAATESLARRAAIVLQQLREAHRKRLEGMQAFNHHHGAVLA